MAPADATNKNVTWSSDNEAAATVSSTGLVTAVAAGSATITVTTEDGGFTDTCAVTVNPAGPVLAVKYQGTTIKSYTMAQLKALTPAFSGYAGMRCNCGYIAPIDLVTGVKITDIVADARGTALTAGQAVTVSSGGYGYTFSYDRLVNFTGFTMYDAATDTPVAFSSLTGPLRLGARL